jgi:glutaredoxin
MALEIKLYGTDRCHKTIYYKDLLKRNNVEYLFLDVERNDRFADELRALYDNRKLNFPTITIGNKRLRNPSEIELSKWINKLK